MIRMATKNDVIELMGKPFEHSFKGVAVEVDKKVLGIAGIMYTQETQGFMSIKPEIKKYPRLFVEGIRKMKQIMNECETPIYAKPSPDEETAIGFLKHIGFEYWHEGIYKWTR